MHRQTNFTKKDLLSRITDLEYQNGLLRKQLENVLSPSVYQGKLQLKDIIDIKEMESMLENFFKLTNIPTAIVDTKGNVLVGAGWQNICTRFHRVNPESCRNCIESDTILTSGILEGEFKLYKCKNGMWDLATPIIVAGDYVGNIFMGQFFFDDEPVDYEYFRNQARKFDFNEKDYISSLNSVPRINSNDLTSAKAFFIKIAHSISQLSYNNITLTRLLSELREIEENTRVILNVTSESIIMYDRDGIIITANATAIKRLKISKESIIGYHLTDIFPHDIASSRMKYFTRVVNTCQPIQFEDERHGITFHHTYYPVIENGVAVRIVTYSKDITEQKKADDRLRKLSRAVEYSPNSILITDKNGTIEYANPMFTDITGYSASEVIGKTPSIMKSGKTDPDTYESMWHTIRSGKQWRGSFQNKKKSGELFWESVNISPVPDSHGNITHFIAIKEDITKRIEHEEQLNKLNRTLNALRHIGDAIIRDYDEESYLYDICSIIVEDCGHPLVWIGFAENDEEKSVRPVGWAGFDESYIYNLKISWGDNPHGRGPTGTAMRRATITVCRNMLTDPHFSPWREEALKRGYASSVVFPLIEDGAVFGAISIYSKEPDAFSEGEVDLLDELSKELIYGLRIIRLRKAHALAEIELKKNKENLEKIVRQRTLELKTANEILTEAQSVAHLGNWHLDHISGKLIWSDEIYRIFGIEPNVFGSTLEAFLTFVHPDDREYVSSSFANSVKYRTLYNIDHRILRPNGEVRYVHERCITHYNQNGTANHSLGVIQDITDQKTIELELEIHKNHLEELIKLRTAELALANQQLQFEIEKEKQIELLLKESLEKERALNEMKSRFISTTSHEFRTPLTSVLSSTQLIQRYRHKWNEEKLEEQFNYIKNSIFNLTKLLDDILTISHADSGRIIFNPQFINLHELCLKIIEEVKHKAGENHKFQFRFISKEKEFQLDVRLIRFTIINLLSNAFKYSPNGGCVTLKVSSTTNMIQFCVSDQGIGIPEEDKQHLFKPFSRAGNTGDIEGTGLGLSIVQRAVDLHKGNINFKSEIGKGTTFIIEIPRD